MYKIVFYERAEKQFGKLTSEIQKKIVNSLERIKIRPFHFVKKLIGSKYFRLRVGDYRLILDIKKEKIIIFVIELGHRKKVYKKIL